MPYKDVSEVPSYVKKYTSKIQRQWMKVFNSTYYKVLEETSSKRESERRAMMAANSVLTKRFEKNRMSESNSDYFQHLVDKFIGNL
jgi:cation transport regulator ChaB